MTPPSKRAVRGLAVASVATAALSCLALLPAGADTGATVGAASAGDRLFPQLGNGGYDARSYDLSFDYRPERTAMAARVTMTAVATQDLAGFSLDSAGQRVRTVTVNGQPAGFHMAGEKLSITPHGVLPDRHSFVTRIDYVADRDTNPTSPALHLPPGTEWPVKTWINTPDGFAVMGQPDRAHVVFPSNDHPSDKALFTFHVTTPADRTAVANGTLVDRRAANGRTTFVYRTDRPIPTNVVQVAVGRFTRTDALGPYGLPLHSYAPTAQAAKLAPAIQRTGGQVAWAERTLGLRLPYSSYGVLAVDGTYDGVALETPTISTFPAVALAQPDKAESPTQVHELIHQYFGDTVSPHTWDDMWISEGHATYYQLRYAADRGFTSMDQAMKETYAGDARQRATAGPAARLKNAAGVLFSTDAPGALTLYALRQEVGDQTFQRIERTFFATHRYSSATTHDYIAVANRVSGRDLTGFLDSWLYGATTPPMPGHPDWTTAQPTSSAAPARPSAG
jgi:aminopeptidase N